MYTSFKNISDNARIWIYQSDRVLQENEIEFLEKNLQVFLEKWTAHGNELFASAKVEYDVFLIIALDEKVNSASGCSIDASVHFIKEIEKNLNNSFFDRTKIGLLESENLELVPVNELTKRIDSGKISADDLTFNHLIQYKKDLDNNWKIPLGSSWLKKYFKEKNTTA